MILHMGGGGTEGKTVLTAANGTTQPASPKPNTLWLNTTATLGRLAVQAYAPATIDGAALAAGDVWVHTTARGAVAITHNGIAYIVHSASVYTGSAWAYVAARYYDGTAWATLGLHLLHNGDYCASVTGGWNLYYTGGYSSVVLTANGLEYSNGAMAANWGAQTAAAVDLTQYGYLLYIGYHNSYIDAAAYPTLVGAGNTQMALANSATNIYSALATINTIGAYAVAIDIAALNGTYKVGIGGVAIGRLSEVIVF